MLIARAIDMDGERAKRRSVWRFVFSVSLETQASQ